MHIIAVGLNFRTTPVEIREKFTFLESELPEALQQLRKMKSILECTIISTCNRMEVYVVADQLHTGRYYTKAFLAEWFKMEIDELTPMLNIWEDDEAILHLFRVTAGLDSMIVGETQILGQMRDAFLLAQQQASTGTIFNELFKQAVTVAKRAHSETAINDNPVSVSYAAVELAKKIFGSFGKKHVLLVGAGKMSELAAKHLHANGAQTITVINRTESKAEELASRFAGTSRPISQLEEALSEADILISSTGAREYIVTAEMMKTMLKKRKGRPIFMVDIAVPRDLDPALSQFDDVYLYDIDDLEGIVESNLAERKKEAEKIEVMLEKSLIDFKQWLQTLGVVPLISALRTKALNIQAETMESIQRKLPNLSEREMKVLSKHTKSIINQMLRDPITRIKEFAGEEDAEQSLKLVTKIFALEDELQSQREREEAKQRAAVAELEWEKKKQQFTASARHEDAVVRS